MEAARQVTTISTNLVKQVEELSNEGIRKIRLGISVQRGMELLPELYPRFKNDSPCGIELHEQGPRRWKKSVLEGRSESHSDHVSKHADLYYDLIQEEQLVLIVNRDCALAKRIRPGTPIDIFRGKG